VRTRYLRTVSAQQCVPAACVADLRNVKQRLDPREDDLHLQSIDEASISYPGAPPSYLPPRRHRRKTGNALQLAFRNFSIELRV